MRADIAACGQFYEDMSNLVNPVKLLSPRPRRTRRPHRRREIINQMNDPTPATSQSAHVSGYRRRKFGLGQARTITLIGQDGAGKAMEGGWQWHCGSHFSDLSRLPHDFIELHLTTLQTLLE